MIGWPYGEGGGGVPALNSMAMVVHVCAWKAQYADMLPQCLQLTRSSMSSWNLIPELGPSSSLLNKLFV